MDKIVVVDEAKAKALAKHYNEHRPRRPNSTGRGNGGRGNGGQGNGVRTNEGRGDSAGRGDSSRRATSNE